MPYVIPQEWQTKSPFPDVEVSYGLYNDILWAWESGLIRGGNSGLYRPTKAVSSITVIAVLCRLENWGIQDATSGLWYQPYLNWANKYHIIPPDIRIEDDVLSRGATAKLLVSYIKAKGRDVTPPANRAQFVDSDIMLEGENDAFQYLYRAGIFKGTNALQMSPRSHLTRAQLAALMSRVYDLLDRNDISLPA